MNVHFGVPSSMDSVTSAVPLYGTKEFESPTRSTIPMLSMLIHAPDRFAEIIASLDMPSGYETYLEFTVKSPKGRGKASHTDVMLKTGSDVLAIEAKWTEPMYEPVSDWLKKSSGPNRPLVLEGWLDLLRSTATVDLQADQFGSVIYQMLHRAASAAASGSNPRLAYFLFKPSNDNRSATSGHICEELSRLWSLLGSPESFPFYVVEIEMTSTSLHNSLCERPKNEETSEEVSAALQGDSPLFEFGDFRITQIGRDEIG